MKTHQMILIILICATALASLAMAAGAPQAGGYELAWYTVDGGGGAATGGGYSLSATAGQADAGVLLASSYRLQGGFWSGDVFQLFLPTLRR